LTLTLSGPFIGNLNAMKDLVVQTQFLSTNWTRQMIRLNGFAVQMDRVIVRLKAGVVVCEMILTLKEEVQVVNLFVLV
jgi:hypothetical protein